MPVCNYNLTFLADFVTILTAGVALYWFGHKIYEEHRKTKKLEDFLFKQWKAHNPVTDKGDYRHSIIFLMAELGLTADEVLQASFRSENIRPIHVTNTKGITVEVRLQHKDAPTDWKSTADAPQFVFRHIRRTP